MHFIETPVFTAGLRRFLDDDSYRALQLALLLRPAQGSVIPGTRGLRKVRWGGSSRGKRGGIRVIYYWARDENICYMLFVYAKHRTSDLTRRQMNALARLVEEEFK